MGTPAAGGLRLCATSHRAGLLYHLLPACRLGCRVVPQAPPPLLRLASSVGGRLLALAATRTRLPCFPFASRCLPSLRPPACRFACSDLLAGLPAGFDGRPVAPLPLDWDEKVAKKWKGLVSNAAAQADARLARLQAQQGGGGGGGGGAAAAAGAAGGAAQAGQAHAGSQQQQGGVAREHELAVLQQAALAHSNADAQQQEQAAKAADAAAAQAAAQQGAAAAAAGADGGGLVGEARGAVEAAQQAGGAAGLAEVAGDAALDAAAFDRVQEAQAEEFQQQQAMQAAAGGDAQLRVLRR